MALLVNEATRKHSWLMCFRLFRERRLGGLMWLLLVPILRSTLLCIMYLYPRLMGVLLQG